MMPHTQGAKLLYQSYLQPTLRRYSPKIDVVISHVTNFAMALYHMYQVGGCHTLCAPTLCGDDVSPHVRGVCVLS